MFEGVCTGSQFFGCDRPTARASGKARRRIGSLEFCDRCYKYIAAWCKKNQLPIDEESVTKVPQPIKRLTDVNALCPRPGCGKELPMGMHANSKRVIGDQFVCKACYQAAWDKLQELQIGGNRQITLEVAFAQLNPKGWRPDPLPRQTTKCAIPSCDHQAKLVDTSRVGNWWFCPACHRKILFATKREYLSRKTAMEVVRMVLAGQIKLAGELEKCAMSWCNCVGPAKIYGHNGEPICSACATYLFYLARRKGVQDRRDLIHTAPPPRLLHTRGRRC